MAFQRYVMTTLCLILAVNIVRGDDGFKPIFDGKTLENWDGNPAFWTVQDGAITGQTTKENPTKGNTFVVWRGGELENFELRLKYRIVGGNSGIQYRSEEVDKWVIKGYQADFDAANVWAGILYEEKGRGVLAKRTDKVVIDDNGKKETVGKTAEESDIIAAIKKEEWNNYRIIANGHHLIHEINGKVTVDVTDNQVSKRKMKGLLALQLHAGPPMLVQFKDIELKDLGSGSKASAEKKKITFVAGNRSHGYGSHEHNAGCLLLAKYLTETMGYETVVYRNGWPQDGLAAFEGSDAVVVYCDGGGRHLLNPHIDEFDKLMDQGVGLACIHYGVETPKGKTGDAFLKWIGGYFETHWSVNPHWTAQFKSFPDHPIANGVEPFEINDEWYFHMRFRPEMNNVTPILSAHPPESTMKRNDGAHSGNPHVRTAMKRGEIQHVAWAAERENGGRGFGFTGGHVHWNWGDKNFRRVVLNAIVWIAKGDVPQNGVGGFDPTQAELEANQDFPKPEKKKALGRAERFGNTKPAFRSKVVTTSTPGHAVDVRVDIKNAKKLYLIVRDGGNGYGCDWANWIAPKLVGPNGEKPLTDLKWKSATTDWGQVRVNKNAGGGALSVAGQPVKGIGTHANSVIEYDLPKGYTKFVAKAGLDNGGTDQGDGSATSVQFFVYTNNPPKILTSSDAGAPSQGREPKDAVDNLDVHEKLQTTLFAAEPQLLSPSNIDIDEKGRVWVCEIVNYRRHKGKRPEGDRILILEDTDADGKVDREKVFYQGTDIDSPHGVCVLGNQAIVSAGANVFVFTDNDGDDKPDDKKVLFTGISGTQHDHGIHQFHFGPDGKLYFNFGNEGKQLQYADGKYVVDKAGNEVRATRQPYQQGMVFRCNLDGSEFETLGWNFRNNWMAAVDSFGTIWQSDNDDDGNRGVRINFVMEFGDYGYRDSKTGAGWRSERTGMHPQIPIRHWHQNDPGVVPNLLATGAGSPTGIMIYEGTLLPKVFQNEMIHCDAGPSVTRCYPVKNSGAGYTASIVNLLEGTRDRWFRPSDVKAAPDGSLIVADWYDPGVGGHAMGDLNRGRLFRVLPDGHDGGYQVPKFDFNSAKGAVQALRNPNSSVRYLAWTALHQMGGEAESALQEMWKDKNPRMRARALWLLGKIEGQGQQYVDAAMQDSNANIRITGLRLARQLESVDNESTVMRLVNDQSPQVRRECCIALRHLTSDSSDQLWAELAKQHDGDDRWYLEALGIGAELRWNQRFKKWMDAVGDEWDSKAGRDIIWRSRADDSPAYLAKLIQSEQTPTHEIVRCFRAFDFFDRANTSLAIRQLALQRPEGNQSRRLLIARESFNRVGELQLENTEDREALDRALGAAGKSEQFVKLVAKFSVADRYPSLLDLARKKPLETVGMEAMKTLLSKDQTKIIVDAVQKSPADQVQPYLVALGNTADNRAASILKKFVIDKNQDLEIRRQSVRQMAKLKSGAEELLKQARGDSVEPNLKEAVVAALTSSDFRDIRDESLKLFPARQSKDANPLPPIRELAKARGNVGSGQKLYATTATCAKCHIVNGKGTDVGPDLSEIGSKLSREAMFESIIYPSAGISHNYETYSVVLADGNVVSGLLTSRTDEEVVIKDKEGVVRKFNPADVDEIVKSPISVMPADLSQTITQKDLIDIVEYLTTLKK